MLNSNSGIKKAPWNNRRDDYSVGPGGAADFPPSEALAREWGAVLPGGNGGIYFKTAASFFFFSINNTNCFAHLYNISTKSSIVI